MSTEIYLGGSFRIELEEDLTEAQIDALYHKAYGQTITFHKPFDEATRRLLGIPDTLTDYVDEVEILGGV